jgi:hypothetical protein
VSGDCKKPRRIFQESQKRLEEIAETRFDLRLLQEFLNNPHFGATNHTHQDR